MLSMLSGLPQPGGQVRERPPSTWAWTCGTVWPACGPVLKTTRHTEILGPLEYATIIARMSTSDYRR
jgi:hypothetical protein